MKEWLHSITQKAFINSPAWLRCTLERSNAVTKVLSWNACVCTKSGLQARRGPFWEEIPKRVSSGMGAERSAVNPKRQLSFMLQREEGIEKRNGRGTAPPTSLDSY